MSKIWNQAALAHATFSVPKISPTRDVPERDPEIREFHNDCEKCSGYHICTCPLSFEETYFRAVWRRLPPKVSPQYESLKAMRQLIRDSLELAQDLSPKIRDYYNYDAHESRDKPALTFNCCVQNGTTEGRCELLIADIGACNEPGQLTYMITGRWNTAFARCVQQMDWVEYAINHAPTAEEIEPFAYVSSDKQGAELMQGYFHTPTNTRRWRATPIAALHNLEMITPGDGLQHVHAIWSRLRENRSA